MKILQLALAMCDDLNTFWTLQKHNTNYGYNSRCHLMQLFVPDLQLGIATYMVDNVR